MPLDDGLFRFSLLLLFVPVSLGAGFGLLLTVLGIRRRARVEQWPAVAVRVLDHEVEQGEHRGWYFMRTRTWDLVVDYEYDFEGRAYRSQVRLEADVPGGNDPDPQVLENALAQTRRRLLDSLHAVRVNPDDPTETALTREPSARAWLRLAAFAAATLVSLFVLKTIFSS